MKNYDHWKTTNPDDEWLGNADQARQEEERVCDLSRREEQELMDAFKGAIPVRY